MEYFVDKKSDGKTVLETIKKQIGLSSAHLKHLKFIDRGICVNGEQVTVRYILREGDILTLATDEEELTEKIAPVDLHLDIAYEDDDCVIPSKPADMPTHPSHGHYDDTVANALAFRYLQEGRNFVFRPVNRLDRNTSGLLIIAKNRIGAGRLSEDMKSGNIKKAYIAILDGTLPSDDGYIEGYMRRTAESIIVREVCEECEGADYALTLYRTLAKTDRYTLVMARPITGRTHQLRVHFASLGAPILGDDMYGRESELIGRHALHSACLSFPRVSDREQINVISPLPDDIKRAATEIFGEIPEEGTYAEYANLLFKETQQR